jgi:hypothetical protein
MKSNVHRTRLLRVGAKAVHVEREYQVVDTFAPRGCEVGRDLPDILLQVPRACIYSKPHSRNQTSGCSLVQPCSSPGKDRIGLRCTWNSGSVDHAGSWALHNDHIRFRALPGMCLLQQTRKFHSAPLPRERSLPQRMAGREDQRSPVPEVKRRAKESCGSWRLLAVAQLRVGEQYCDDCHEASLEWQMPYVCDVP